jgi:hypothetical protein
VSAGTLILCLTGGGLAAASMTPAPSALDPSAQVSVPPPGDIVQLVKDTATGVVDKVTTIAGQPAKQPTTSPDREPATRPALHLPSHPAHPSTTAPKSAPASWSLPSETTLSSLMPALPTDWDARSARTPVVAAGLTSAPPAQVRNAAEAAADPTGRGSDVMRGVLLALAVAAAATIGAGHVTVARSR